MADRIRRPDGKDRISQSSEARTGRKKRRTNFLALEPRVMYDGAAAATAIGGGDHHNADAHAPAAQATFSATPTISEAAPPTPPPPAPPPAPAVETTGTIGADKTTDNHLNVQADPGGGNAATSHDIVFIDGSVPDLQTLVDAVKPGDSVYILTGDRDGVQQVADVIAQNGLHDLSSIQIVSHGNQGEIQLGSSVVTDANLSNFSAALAQIGSALKPGGDLLLFGCDVGSGAGGQQFISDLSTLTGGAHVAASTNPTGAAALGGDWTLEATTGTIDASSAFDASSLALYPDLLNNETLTVSQSTVGTNPIDPNGTDIVTTTVTITNNSTNTDALNVALQETLNGLTPNGIVDVQPLAFDDSYDAVGNTLLEVGTVAGVSGPHLSAAGSVLNNDMEFLGDSLANDVLTFDATSANGGTINMVTAVGADRGSFTYVSAAGFAGSTDTFHYTLTDKGLDGTLGTADDMTSSGTVTIHLTGQVWYVNNQATGAGTGTSTDPFQALTSAGAAAGAGDTIYVEHGDGTTAHQASGVTLTGDGERLIGSGVALTVAGTYNGVLNPTLEAAGTAAKIDNTAAGGNAVSATDVIPGEIAGLSIHASNDAIHLTVTNGDTGTTSIHDNTVTGAGGDAIKIADSGTVAGATWTVNTDNNSLTSTGNAFDAHKTGAGNLDLDFSNNTVSSGATGVNIDGSTGAGTLFITGFANDTVNGNTAGTGVSITAATFDATPSGTFQTVSGGILEIGSSGNGVGANGMVLTSVSGDLSFSDFDIFADAGTALKIAGTTPYTGSAGIRVTVGAGVATLAAVGGAAADVSTATIDLQLASLTSTNSATTGVNLDAVVGTFSAGNSSAISNASGTSFRVNSSNAAVTYNGTISNSAGAGVSLTNNTGSTIAFTGALTLSSGANPGFTATGGGTVTASNTTSTIATTTGTALDVADTTIGSAGLHFKSISANGAANGILLKNTGTSGGLTVTGGTGTATGGDGSGGTIQNTTAAGIELIDTSNVSLNNMKILTTVGSGIDGHADPAHANIGVQNFSFTHGTISDSGLNSAGDTATGGLGTSNIAFNTSSAGTEKNVTGTVTITDNVLTNALDSGVYIHQFAGTISNLNISGNTITSTDSSVDPTLTKGSGILLDELGSASAVASITQATIDHNTITNFASGGGIEVLGGNATNVGGAPVGTYGQDSSHQISITNNTIHGEDSVTLMGAQGIEASVTGRGTGNFFIDHNDIQNVAGIGIGIGSNGLAQVNAEISNNTIDANNTSGAAGIGGGTTDVFGNTDNPLANFNIHDNTISDTDGSGIFMNSINASAHANYRIVHNTVSAPLENFTFGIRVSSGSVGSGTETLSLEISNNNTTGDGAAGIGLRKQGTNVFQVVGWNGTSPTVDAYVTSQNPGSVGGTTIIAGTGFTGIASLPNNLIVAPGGVDAAPAASDPGPQGGTTQDTGSDSTGTGTTASDQGATGSTADSTTTTTPSGQDATETANVNGGVLTQADLDAVVAAALQRWEATGLSAEQVAYLQSVNFSIADLGGMSLGAATNGHVTIDTNAAGHGWFIDPTPLGDSEFSVNDAGALYTTPDQAAAGHVDLLTTVMHEMGHELGLSDTYATAAAADVMYGYIVDGERRLPAAGEAAGATPGDIVGQDFLLSNIATIPDLPAGKQIQIEFQSTVDAQANQLIANPTAQGSVSTSNGGGLFPTVTTSTNTVTLEALKLRGTVWNDNGAGGGGGTANDGLLNGTEAGIDGATVKVFADQDGNDVPDSATPLATTTTSGGGNYAFDNLAPGNYIVQVTLPAPFTNASSVVAADPNGNVDGNNDGQPAVGGIVSTKHITLAYDTEPTQDATQNLRHDINSTLDVGLIANQPPVLDLDADDDHGAGTSFTSTFTEGGAGAAIADTDVSVTDPDNTTLKSSTITITNLQAGDLLTFTANANTGDITAGAFAGGALTLTSAGGASFATWQAALQAVTYSNTSDDPSSADRTIDVTIDDGQSTNHVSNTAVDTVHVIPVNDPPTLSATTKTVTYTEDGAASDLFDTVSISTVEAGQAITELQFTVGNVNEAASEIVHIDGADVALTNGNSVATTNGSALVALSGGTATVTWTSAGVTTTVAQGIVDGMTYRDASEDPTAGARTVTLTAIKDNGGTANSGIDTTTLSDASTVTVVPVNDAPTLNNVAATADYTENTSAVTLSSAISISDIDPVPHGAPGGNGEIKSATVTIASGFVAGDQLVVFDTTLGTAQTSGVYTGLAISYNFDSTTHVLTLSGVDTIIDYNHVLKNVQFVSSSENPTNFGANPTRTINWQVTDNGGTANGGQDTSSLGATTLTVHAVNDAPTATAGGTQTYTEQAAAVVVDNTVTLSDVDSQNLAGATVTIDSTNFQAGDTLHFTNQNGITGTYSAATHTLTLSGSSSVLNYQTALRSVTFDNLSNDNPTNFGNNPSRTVTWQVDDGSGAGNHPLSNQPTSTINITAVNDAPTLTAGATTAYTEQAAAVVIDNTVTVADVDSADLAGATVTISSGLHAGDTLHFTSTANIVGVYGNGVLTLTGSATAAEYQAALRSVTFDNATNDNPTGTSRVITWRVDDGSATNHLSNTPTSTITFTAVNDAPVNGVPSSISAGVNQSTAITGLSVSDADAGSANITVELKVTHGVLTIANNVAGGLTAGGIANNGTADVTLTGSQAAIDATLAASNGVIYAPAANFTGSDQLTMNSSDLGNTGSGGTKTDSDTVAITVGNVSAVQTTVLTTDVDGDGIADPGADTVTTTVVITNSSGTNANNTSFNEVLDGMTIVPGTLNVSPLAFNDSYNLTGNTPISITAANGLLANDVEFLGATFGTGAGQTHIQNTGNIITTHGVVSLAADGSFTYTPTTGYTGTDSFTYTLVDAGGLTGTGTATFNVSGLIWYVDSSASSVGADGSFNHPFTSLAPLNGTSNNGATTGDPDGPGDTIFVYNRGVTYTSASITLENNETFLGDGASLTVNGHVIDGTAGNTALGDIGGTIITLGSGNTVRGFDLGLASTDIVGSNFGTLTIDTVNISNQGGGAGGALTLDTGAFGANSSFLSISSGGGTHAIHLGSVTGTVDLGNGSLSGASGATFDVSGGSVSATYHGSITQANNAAMVSVSGGHTGTLTFQTGTLSATNGTGLQFDNADGTYNFNGTTTLNGGDAGIDILDGSSGTFFFSSNTSITNPSGTSFNLDTSNATVNYHGSISDNSGYAVDINNADAGTITFDTGSITSTGTGLRVRNSNGGTVSFNDPSISLSTAASTAVDLSTNNGGDTINFVTGTGTGLVITTTTGTGFLATGGGTVNVTGSNNTISTGAGVALDVESTTIGASGLIFKSISDNGGANGILLKNTGTTGGLTVTGGSSTATGGDGSGGTIQNTTAAGIELIDTANVSLNNMKILTTVGSGIDGHANSAGANIGVQNFSFTHGTISNSGLNGSGTAVTGATGVGNITFNTGEFGVPLGTEKNLTGTVTITNNVLTNAFYSGVDITQYNGTISNANISSNTFTSTTSQVTSKSSAIEFNSFGSATTVANVTKATIDSNTITNFPSAAGIIFNGGNANSSSAPAGTYGSDPTTNRIAITNNTIHGQSAAALMGTQGIFFSLNGTGSGYFFVNNNNIQFVTGIGIAVGSNGMAQMHATISNNTIDAHNTVGSSGIGGGTTHTFADTDTPLADFAILGNTISNTNGPGIFMNSIHATAHANYDIENNNVSAPTDGSGTTFGIRVAVGTSHSTETETVSLLIKNNTTAGDSGNGFVASGIGLRKDSTASNITFNIVGMAAGSQGSPTVENYVNSQNPNSAAGNFGVGGTTLISATTGFTGIASLPSNLIVAPGGVEPDAPAGDGSTSTAAAPSSSDGAPSGTSTDPATQTAGDGTTTSTPPATDVTNVNNGILTQADLDAIVAAALQRWEATGLSQAQIAYLQNVTFGIADLGGLYLGEAQNGQVTIDNDAAGHGWYIDPTPMSDGEFTVNNAGALYTTPDQAAAGHIDLLTTVMHEMGHELGLADNYAPTASGNLMFGFIEDGERRLPVAGMTDGAVLGSIGGADFAIGPVSLGTLPAGKSLTVQWQATVDPQSDQLAHNPTNFGTVTGSNFATAVTNTVVTPVDTLTLGDRVFFDADNSGTFNAGDSGIDGVALTLFADTNHSGVLDAGDTQIATTVTSNNGLYSFTGLAPGDYIVRADQSNFAPGGALAGVPVAAPGAVDPDNNVDHDSNGIPIAGNGVASLPITLAYNTEPTNDSTGHGDINNTLDFGFQTVPVDQPPVVTAGSTVTFNEGLVGGTPVTLEPGITVTDADTLDLASASVRISTGFLNGDQLTFDSNLATSLGITGSYDPGTGLLSFSGSVTPASYQSVLRTVQFSNSGDNPDANGADTTRQITWIANDGAKDSIAAHTTVDIVAQNDAPSGTNGTVTVLEDGSHVFTAADFGFTDVDGNALQDVIVSPLVGSGTLTFNGSPVVADTVIAVANIGQLVFTPAADANGANYAHFSFHVQDDGGTAHGGVDTSVSANTLTINVTSVNDAPTGQNESATIAEDNVYTFQATDFSQGFSDSHDSPANNFLGVVITSQSASGTLKLSGATFANGTFIDASQIGNLTFTPNADFNGDATFTFEVRDDGGIANGGQDTSSPPNTFTVHVTAVNDPPIANPDTLTAVNEDSGQRTIAFTDLTANDSPGPLNESTQTLTIIDVNNAVGGTVSISGTDVLFTPNANFNGTASFDYTEQDNGTTDGSPDFKTAVGHVTFTVNAVNDAPVVTLPTSYTAQPNVAVPINNVILTDVDENDAGAQPTWLVTLSVGTGTLDGADGDGTFGGVKVTNSHSTSMTLQGSLADLRTYLDTSQKISFTGSGTNTTLTVTLNDKGNVGSGGEMSDTTTASITFNAPPVIAGDLQESVLEGGTVIITGLDLSASDPDGPVGETLTYTVTGTTNGQVLLNGVATTTFTEAQLENSNVSFQHDGSETLTASFTVTVTDTGSPPATSAPATVNIAVTPVNDPPVLENVKDIATYQERTAAQTLSPGTVIPPLDVTDVDSTKLTGATVAITTGFFTGDELTINGSQSGSINNGANGTITYSFSTVTGILTLGGTDTLADYQAALQSVQFDSPSHNPDNFGTDTTRTVEWQVTDQDAHGSNNLPSGVVQSTILVSAIDDPPVAVDDGGTAVEAGGTLNGTPGSPASGNVILGGVGGAGADSDVDNHVSDLIISAIRTGPEAGAGTAGTVGQALQGSFGKLTLGQDGNYTYVVDDNNATVQALNVGQTLTDNFTYTLQDPGGLTDKATLAITIQGRNDAPVAVNDTASATEKGGNLNNTGGVDPSGNVITANDSDVDNTTASLQIASVRTGTEAGSGTAGTVGQALQGSFGKLTLNQDGTYHYAVDQTNPTVEALQSADTLTDTFTYVVKDPGNLSDTAQLTVTIHGADDAPVARDDAGSAQASGSFFKNTPALGNVITKGTGADTDVDDAQSSLTVSALRTGTESGSGTSLALNQVVAGKFGFLFMQSDGSYIYVANDFNPQVAQLGQNQTLTESFTYTVTDPHGLTDKATLTITIKGDSHTPPPHGDGDAGHPHDDGGHDFGHGGDASSPAIGYNPTPLNLPNGFSLGSSVYIVHAEADFIATDGGPSFSVALQLLPFETSLGGSITLIDARLADGSPLPDWLHFDGQKLAFAGTPPAGMVASLEPSDGQSADNLATGSIPKNAPTDGPQNGDANHLTIEVVAQDSSGNLAIMTFTLTLKPGGHTSIDPLDRDGRTDYADRALTAPDRFGWTIDHDRLARAAGAAVARPIVTDHGAVQALPGRASLAQQLDRSGWRSLHANRTALLQSLRDSAGAWQ
jgi:VCBS repeat-containing protein